MIKPPPNVLEFPLEVRAEMAMRAAVEKVIIEHARAGQPIYIWEDGKVVEVPVEELRERAAKIQAEGPTWDTSTLSVLRGVVPKGGE